MSFVDLRFLLFFPTVVVLYILFPPRFRWALLLVASYLFYMAWKPEYALLLLAITAIDFVAGLAMGRTDEPGRRRLFLITSLVANLGILFFFKYFNFFFASVAGVFHFLGSGVTFPVLNILLPIGISFHIFQSMSYTIDVYKRRFEPVRHFGKFALYVSFFPQLVAGPIERPQGLLKQIMENRGFDLAKARSGTKLMAWGFFKKLVIADNLAPLVNAVYEHPEAFAGPSLIIAILLFTYQVYCDFSGYTDIARGAARIFGYELMLNFDRPFTATSIAEFWRRWHISLSSWARDYLYYPLALGGKHHSRGRAYASIFLTFALIGLWHGANWNYVIFGALHGMYSIVGSYTQRARTRAEAWLSTILHFRFAIPVFFKRIIVFCLVSFSFMFFRAASLSDALYITAHLGSGYASFFHDLTSFAGLTHALAMDVAISGTLLGMLGIFFLEWIDTLDGCGALGRRLISIPERWRFVLYGAGICVILAVGAFGTTQQFIYFQF